MNDAPIDRPISSFLLIDDDSHFRGLVREVLGALFPVAKLTETGDTEEARRLLAMSDFDCVVIDYRLGGATGIELLEEAFPSTVPAGTGIVMLTGEGNEDVAVAALKAGAHDYLVKETFTSAGFYRAIRSATNSARLGRRAYLQKEVLEGLTGLIATDLGGPLERLTDRLETLIRAGVDADEELRQAFLADALEDSRSMAEALRNLTFLAGDGGCKED